jgi:hypothetical protein
MSPFALLAWDVVAAFSGDPLGELFRSRRGAVVNFLTTRNASLFAHGFRPVSRGDYEMHFPTMAAFLGECVTAALPSLGLKRPVVLEQLPTDFLDV